MNSHVGISNNNIPLSNWEEYAVTGSAISENVQTKTFRPVKRFNDLHSSSDFNAQPSQLIDITAEITEVNNESVKSRDSCSNSERFYLKPIRLTDWTQELLDAENEPLKPLTINEDANESDVESSEKAVPENTPCSCVTSDKTVENVQKEKEPHCDSFDLGVSWLETNQETPFKIPINNKNDNSTSTLENHMRELFVTPVIKNSEKQFTTPQMLIPSTTAKGSTKPKIQYSINIKHIPKTPMNNIALKNNKRCLFVPQSRTKSNPVFKNTGSDVILSSELGLQEKHENSVKSKVNFLLPEIQLNSDNFKKITVKDATYIILNQLGKGGSSIVYHCYNPYSKCERAIKKVGLGESSSAVGYINEVKMLEKLQKCDRIITMYDYEIIESENTLLVVLERGGLDLSKILKDLCTGNNNLPMHMLIFYWMEMLYAVKQIHENGIIHSDLKPGNFLKAEGGLKLIDFGIASCIQNDMTSVARDIPIGSFNYISPEALIDQSSSNCDSPSFGKPKYKVSYKSDVWSLGCILYQLVYRKTPFYHITHTLAKLATIMDPQHKIEYPESNWVPVRILNTIKNCLKFNTKDRPSIDELIQEYENIYN